MQSFLDVVNAQNGRARELQDFIEQSIDDPAQNWPRRSAAPTQPERRTQRVLVIGDVALEMPIECNADRNVVLNSLRLRDQSGSFKWTLGASSVGGFAVHAGQIAQNLGARVAVLAALPAPLPRRFQQYLEASGFDLSRLMAIPGPCPIRFVLNCHDGQLHVRRHGVCLHLASCLSTHMLDGFDVVLADPGAVCNHADGARAVLAHLDCVAALAGIRVGRYLSPDRLHRAGDAPSWTFVQLGNAARALRDRMGGVAAPRRIGRDQLRSVGSATKRLVFEFGDGCGAALCNGCGRVFRVPACPMKTPVGPISETLLTVTTLSSACGADDRASLRRGVLAATGVAAGLDLPSSLDELDVPACPV